MVALPICLGAFYSLILIFFGWEGVEEVTIIKQKWLVTNFGELG